MCCWPGPPTPNGVEITRNGGTEPEDPIGREDRGRGAWRYPNSYNPAVSIEAGANGDPVEMNGEREPEMVCTSMVGKAGDKLGGAI